MICLASLALVVEVAVDLDLNQCISTKALNTWVHFAFCEVFDIQGSTFSFMFSNLELTEDHVLQARML